MKKLFCPNSVVVVGVSPVPNNLGCNILRNLAKFEFPGKVYAVGLDGGSVDGIDILASVSNLPEPVDLAVVLTPAKTVPAVIRECGERGIPRAVIMSAGFAELSEERLTLQQELIDAAKQYDVRFIGPNCMGLINTGSGLAVPFSQFDRKSITKGSLSILAQSGSVAFTAAWLASWEGVGLAKYASMGNKLSVDEVDLLPYLIEDEQTKTICMYLEGLTRGRELVELAKRADKPVVVLKGNISQETERVARSHTASLASDDRVVEGAFRQAGITRVTRVADFMTAAKALNLPPLRGNNIAVVGTSGGTAVISADFCHRNGFRLPNLPEPLLADLSKQARAKVIRLGNPLDLGDTYDNGVILQAVEQTIALPEIDGLLLNFFHFDGWRFAGPDTYAVIDRVAELVQQHQKPVLLSFATEPQFLHGLKQRIEYPVFNDLEDSLAGLAMLRERSRWLASQQAASDEERFRLSEMDKMRIGAEIAAARGKGLADMGPAAMTVLSATGLTTAALHLVVNEEDAVQVAKRMGYPVVLKAVAAELSHKSDVGGVAVNLTDADAVRSAFSEMRESLRRRDLEMTGAVLQRMVQGGHEMILGAKQDAHFGPVVMFGLGGIFAEVFAEVACRLAPLSLREAEQMIRDVKGASILGGVRGLPPADEAALAQALQRLGELVVAFPEIKEVDVNPIKVLPAGEGAIAVDARIVLA